MLQHLETDVSASRWVKHPVSGNVAGSSLCHKSTAPASPPPASPVPVTAQVAGTNRHNLVVSQNRGWLGSALLPGPSLGSELGRTFLKGGYLQIKHRVPSREKQAAQTKRNQLICAEQRENATQPAWFLLPRPGRYLQRCSQPQPRRQGTSLPGKLPGLAQSCLGWLVAVGSRICSPRESCQQPPLVPLDVDSRRGWGRPSLG